MHQRTARVVVKIIGVAAVVFAVIGLWYNSISFSAFESGVLDEIAGPDRLQYFAAVFLLMSAVAVFCYALLAWSGIYFLGLSFTLLWLFAGVAALEIICAFTVRGLGAFGIRPKRGSRIGSFPWRDGPTAPDSLSGLGTTRRMVRAKISD